ncbi:hypothetical protein BFP71_13260 [Roseivirga misakiensis]|uniref:Uncharacterized protein n=1 Tax=Roseivirga misakiensis TaxID=1563681 RepID=A0A1E5SZ76_9BACT|nr:hypothetical protein BFP71_13260 [Roseivirga misakiensis]
MTAQSSEPFSKEIERAYAQIQFDIDVEKILVDFKNELIEKEILIEEDLNDPSNIYDKLAKLKENVDPLAFGIQGVIDREPWDNLLSSTDILSLNESTQTTVALFTYYQRFSVNHAKFELQLTENRLLEFKGENVPINSLESILFEEIDRLAYRNVTSKNVRIVIKADPKTPNEFVTFIIGKLRKMDLRSVEFR